MKSMFASVLVMLCVYGGDAGAQVNALPQARHVLVFGEANARAIPDRFRIKITFTATSPKVDAAREKVENNLQSAIARLEAVHVPAQDIVATSLQIAPSNEYDQTTRRQVFKGMTVTRELSARFPAQDALKQFLSELQTSQDVQVSGVTTELAAEPELRRQLREKAIASTRDKAAVIAKAYGVRLIGLYSVSDTAPEFRYGITEGDWPETFQWNDAGGYTSLDSIQVSGARNAYAAAAPPPPAVESFQTGYVEFTDKIYAVFLIGE